LFNFSGSESFNCQSVFSLAYFEIITLLGGYFRK